jgi:hypothetical protein
MKKFLLLLASSLFIANFAVSAQADSGKDKMMMGSSKMMGMHKMTGTVDRIDHAKGTLMLKSGVADMALHFPPPAIKDLKDGDTITVELGFAKEGAMK